MEQIMTAQEIINLIVNAGAEDNQSIKYVLEDGEALLSLGVSDVDEDVVEEAHSNITNYIKNSSKYGEVIHSERYYALVDQADYTNRLLPSGYTNYNDAKDGEPYDFEMSANAIDRNGNEYTAYWMFEGIKGEDDPELDTYDYDDIDRVIAI